MHKREDRRDRTYRYGESARREHLRVNHPDGVVDCVCEKSVWFFAKRSSNGCRCRRRSPGNSPKVAVSMCHSNAAYGYHQTVVERIAGKRLCAGWLRARVLDDVIL